MTRMKERIEYAAAAVGLKILGILPRRLARTAGHGFAGAAFLVRAPLRRTAMFNLRLAFPAWNDAKRKDVIRGMVRQIGWMAAEFAQFPRLNRETVEQVCVLEGLENFEAAKRKGKGVLFLTGHMSAWELAPFAQALYGNPLHYLVRPIANRRVDALINKHRCLSGNQPIEKNRSARTILKILGEGGTVGVLADHNTVREEGVFVDFFGYKACTTSGLARLALRTGAAVLPGFLCWDDDLKKYRLQLAPEVQVVQTADEDFDVVQNTARFMKIMEDYIRKHPEQWLWVHKRWKTRPIGEPDMYTEMARAG
jgi:Kdo2-lipid IVA lauroyltransferase/acyltransferase